jgi:hypothetical protein
MDKHGAKSRPYTPVYNRRWDHSTWYLPTKNLLTDAFSLSVYQRSVFVFQRLQLATRLEAVSLAFRCFRLVRLHSCWWFFSEPFTIRCAFMPLNWMDRRLSVWFTPRVSLTFITYSQQRGFGAIDLFRSQKNYIGCSLELNSKSARWVTDMGLLKYFDVFLILDLGTVQES